MPEKSQKTFADVKGCPEAKAELEEVHCYLTTLFVSKAMPYSIWRGTKPPSSILCLYVCTAARLGLNRAMCSPDLSADV